MGESLSDYCQQDGGTGLRSFGSIGWRWDQLSLDSEISDPVTAEARLTRISHHNFHPALNEFFDPLRAETLCT